MRPHEVKISTINEIRDLFDRRQFADCMERIRRERNCLGPGPDDWWTAEYPMTQAYVNEQLHYFHTKCLDLIAYS